MQRLFVFLCLGLIVLNIIFSSWYVLHNDINFSSDIARDFLLLQELDQKKIVLIGPRSSVGGLFHGPLWLYVNYPAYLIGKGNPVVVGWYWIFLNVCFLISCYFIGKKLFNKTTGLLFVLIMSLYMIYHTHALFNPHGALFLLPLFFFFFIRYVQTKKVKYLVMHILTIDALIQFQMAIGSPFLILSFIAALFLCIKQHRVKHLFSYSLILLALSTFLLFDLRHNFILIHSVFRHVQTHDPKSSIVLLIFDRVRIMLSGIEFVRYPIQNGNFYISLLSLVFIFLQIKDNKHKQIYLWFLYFYAGFFAVSLINRYALLYFYVFPIFPFAFLIFSSFVTSRHRYIFLGFFFTIYALNFINIVNYIKSTAGFIGKNEESWQYLHNVSSKVYATPDKEFGFFVYTPDVLGYGPKYAMAYSGMRSDKISYSFQKKPVTYLVIAPPPANNPFMKDAWWIENEMHIKKAPTQTINFEKGYKILRYELTPEEMKVPFDPNINTGIYFR